jgi:hypothetical protein
VKGSMEWIRSHYPVPAKRGAKARVINRGVFHGQTGVVTSANNGYLRFRLDSSPRKRGFDFHIHAMDLEYLDAAEADE